MTIEQRLAERVIEAAAKLRLWGVELDDSRIRYISVQVDRSAVEEFDAALQAYLREKLVSGPMSFMDPEIARLTAERDEWKQKAEHKITERDALKVFFREGEQLEIKQLRADLAAARAALEGFIWAMGSTERHPLTYRVKRTRLPRLGTGEALQAVRGAKNFLRSSSDPQAAFFAKQLEAVFGE